MLLIYCDKISSRLRYTFELVLDNILGIEYSITLDKEEFCNSFLPKLNYSAHPSGDELFIHADDLLFEGGISDHPVNLSNYKEHSIIFPFQGKADLPFDPFAASFYMVSRYEEYLPSERDEFKRYLPQNSIAFKSGFLNKPIVNIWARLLLERIIEKYPTLTYRQNKFVFISTIDVDNAFAFLHKGFIRSCAGLARALFCNMPEFMLRIKTLSGLISDQYDSYSYIEKFHKEYGFKPVFFFLAGKYGKYDKNIDVNNSHFINLVKSLSTDHEIGLHPSFASSENINEIKDEYSVISGITGKKIRKSRQHFLLLRLPETYRNLLSLGIEEDYSMGYPGICGFRAGICTPFRFYDLQNEKETNLLVFPFQVMDTSLNKYMKLSPQEAQRHIEELVDEVKEVNGTFISIWHNESLHDRGKWKGWRLVFEQMLAKINDSINHL